MSKVPALLKWIGNKQRFAETIISYMPEQFNNYYEPFLGSGAVMAQLLYQNSTTSTPSFTHSYASDILPFLIDIFNIVKYDPQQIKNYYSKEIEDYYKAFSRVVVVTSEKNFDSVQQRLQNSPTGICLLTKKGTLSVRKEPIEYGEMLSKPIMFKILRKNEYEQILLKHFGLLPDVSQFEYYRECQAMFESLPIDIAYQMFVQALKSRAKIDVVEYSKIPYELKFLIYFSNYKKSDYAKLCRFLST